MAYSGTTAATSLQNPVIRIGGGMSNQTRYQSSASNAAVAAGQGGGNQLWFYSTTDVSSSLFASGAIADGYELGMKTGDAVIISCFISTVTSSGTITLGLVSSVSTTGGGTQLSSGSFMSST
jgi:hypothetical protein